LPAEDLSITADGRQITLVMSYDIAGDADCRGRLRLTYSNPDSTGQLTGLDDTPAADVAAPPQDHPGNVLDSVGGKHQHCWWQGV
jgi:hypothetical protein